MHIQSSSRFVQRWRPHFDSHIYRSFLEAMLCVCVRKSCNDVHRARCRRICVWVYCAAQTLPSASLCVFVFAEGKSFVPSSLLLKEFPIRFSLPPFLFSPFQSLLGKMTLSFLGHTELSSISSRRRRENLPYLPTVEWDCVCVFLCRVYVHIQSGRQDASAPTPTNFQPFHSIAIAWQFFRPFTEMLLSNRPEVCTSCDVADSVMQRCNRIYRLNRSKSTAA